MVIPLVLFSIITGVASLGDFRKLGKTGLVTLIYYMATTGLAVLVGIILVNLIQPGTLAGIAAPTSFQPPRDYSFFDTLLGFVSPNIFESMAKMDILPIIIFALVLGAVLTTLGNRGKKVLELCETLNQAILKIVGWILYFAPIGIFGLVAARFGEAGGMSGISTELQRLGLYSLVVVLGLAIHGMLVLALILRLVGKRNPWTYFRQVGTALVTAFSTASSSATLPVTLECVEKEAGVSPRSTRFVAPLGATINMDGTALYEAVAAIFIAQVYGVDLTAMQQFIIFITATLAAIGAAGIPEAGLVTMVVVLQAVHLPIEGIGLLLTVDWLLDRFRTTINVWGDAIGCAVVERLGTRSD